MLISQVPVLYAPPVAFVNSCIEDSTCPRLLIQCADPELTPHVTDSGSFVAAALSDFYAGECSSMCKLVLNVYLILFKSTSSYSLSYAYCCV